jgi:predicted permease
VGFGWAFLAVMALITAIACANVLNLQLVRSLTRRREVTVRRALGASRVQVVRQLLVESSLVSAAACLVGLLGAQRITDLVVLRFGNLELPHWVVFDIDWRVLLFTVGAGCATTMLFGLVPALGLSRCNLREMLDGSMGRSGQPVFSRRRAAIVVAQLTISVVIVCAASLVARSAAGVAQVDNGLDEGAGLWLRAQLSTLHVLDEATAVRAFTALTERIERFPEVSAAGASQLSDRAEGLATMRAGSLREHDSPLPFIVRSVSPGYLPAMGARLLRGRLFVESDETAGGQVVIVEESTAQRLFAERDPIGQQVLIDLPRLGAAWHTIIGVVADFHYLTISSATGTGFHRSSERAYIPPRPPPVTVAGTRQVNLLIRTDGAPSDAAPLTAPSLLARIRTEALAIDPNLAVEHIGTIARFTGSDVGALLRQLASVLALCAAITSGLAALGIYGVLSHSAAQRTPEIGVRMALGARPVDAVALVVASGARLTLLGLGIGLTVAFGVNRMLWSLLYEVGPMDIVTLIGASVGLTVVGLLASYLPARRAARVDPMLALRSR